jgi:hypothetical protein
MVTGAPKCMNSIDMAIFNGDLCKALLVATTSAVSSGLRLPQRPVPRDEQRLATLPEVPEHGRDVADRNFSQLPDQL